MKMIEIDQLCCAYGKKEVVHDLTLQLEEGSILGLIGPNGAGKTTTLLALLGLIPIQKGGITVLGQKVGRIHKLPFDQIGYVSENQQIPDHLTVREFLELCASLYTSWDPTLEKKLVTLISLPWEEKIRSLSRGNQMKVKLVSALCFRPRLLIMDEPFTGLDPLVRSQMIQGILELSAEGEGSVLISSHDMEEVERLVDRVALLSEGKLLLEEGTESLLQRFRRVECHWKEGCAPETVFGTKPKGWTQGGRLARWIDESYKPEETERFLATSGVEGVVTNTMSLKEIFIHLIG